MESCHLKVLRVTSAQLTASKRTMISFFNHKELDSIHYVKSLEGYFTLVSPVNLKLDSNLGRVPAQHPLEPAGPPHPQNDDKLLDEGYIKLIWLWPFFFPAIDHEHRPVC